MLASVKWIVIQIGEHRIVEAAGAGLENVVAARACHGCGQVRVDHDRIVAPCTDDVIDLRIEGDTDIIGRPAVGAGAGKRARYEADRCSSIPS